MSAPLIVAPRPLRSYIVMTYVIMANIVMIVDRRTAPPPFLHSNDLRNHGQYSYGG